jgi:Ribonuclease G/E
VDRNAQNDAAFRTRRRHAAGHPEVVKVLKANNAKWLNELEEMIGKTILVKSDPALPPEQFDIQG